MGKQYKYRMKKLINKIFKKSQLEIDSNGVKRWKLPNGKLHRKDGPAVIHQLKQEWWKNGKKHREDGPAVIYSNGKTEWWINGKIRIISKPSKRNKS